MFQISRPLPADVPVCAPKHRPQLVETRGAPTGHRVGLPCPSNWHVECTRCGVATVPHISRAIAELRWRDAHTRIPLSALGRVRAALATINAA
ncbi:hypothetical protein [Lysobacter olei]